jgi:Ubiquitin carboxyl-terminal hydrolase
MQSPASITTPVAPIRKVRRRTLTLEKKESRGRTRARETPKPPEVESDTSDSERDEDGGSKESSKSSLPNYDTVMMNVPVLEISDLSVSPTDVTAPFALPTIPRPSIATAPPRYILRKAYKRMKLQHPLPPIMILHLKRFYGAYSGSMKKLDDFVSFETEFDFGPFVFPPKKSKLLYRLTGVVIHLGSINSGQ